MNGAGRVESGVGLRVPASPQARQPCPVFPGLIHDSMVEVEPREEHKDDFYGHGGEQHRQAEFPHGGAAREDGSRGGEGGSSCVGRRVGVLVGGRRVGLTPMTGDHSSRVATRTTAAAGATLVGARAPTAATRTVVVVRPVLLAVLPPTSARPPVLVARR